MTDIPPPQTRPVWWIVLAMGGVIALLVVSMVLVAINQSSTQHNADQQAKANESLQVELRCRALPALHYDQAEGTLSALIAETLATLGQLSDDEVEERRGEIVAAVTEVRQALDERHASLTECIEGG